MENSTLSFSRPAIAASLSDKDLSLVDAQILEHIDIIELRVDLFRDLSPEGVESVFRKAQDFGKPLIATIRDYAEGGMVKLSNKERLFLFQKVIPLAELIDIEMLSEIFNQVREIVKNERKTLIASFHDFSGTPELDKMEALYMKASSEGADIVKIAVMADKVEDLKRMTQFTLNHAQRVVTLCMGKMSLISRIFFPFIGSLFTFGAVGEPKAPGQVSVIKLRQYINNLSIQG
jgi:3-dehydroquinate dehydratase-1